MIDFVKLEKESRLWLDSIPSDYQKELEGVSLGSGCDIEKIAQWYYCGMCIDGGCTSFITQVDSLWWVGRNTVYSNVTCPSKNIIWVAYSGFPAACKSNWEKIEWNC